MNTDRTATQNWPIEEFSKLMAIAQALKYDDYASANSLVRDARTALRYAFGGSSEYLTRVDGIRFRPEHGLANKGNIVMTGPWNDGVSQIQEILHDAENELRIRTVSQPGKNTTLSIPERMTLAWLWRNLDLPSAGKAVAGFVAVLIAVASAAFSLGQWAERTHTSPSSRSPTPMPQQIVTPSAGYPNSTNAPLDSEPRHTNTAPTN
jgi:hypothetical protein